MQQREASLQDILADKSKIDDHCHTLQHQTGTLSQQVKELHREMEQSQVRVNEVCSLLKEKEKEVERQTEANACLETRLSELETESRKFLQAYEQAVVQVNVECVYDLICILDFVTLFHCRYRHCKRKRRHVTQL